ncbi:MAG: citrate/2-methylcitrate synthase [Candidatus Hodarchaeales archaeon]|jgi:citrate synthase
MAEIKKGLEDVTVLETRISSIDGINGILKYRGIDIHELYQRSYEAISCFLLTGSLSSDEEIENYQQELRAERDIDEGTVEVLHVCVEDIEAMDALRTAISYLSHCDPDLNDNSLEANLRKATKLIAKFPTIVATFWTIKVPDGCAGDDERIPPDPTLSHAANFLYMLRGIKPSAMEAELLEQDFVVSAEHELNASTFSTRVTISTLSDLHSAIISGLATLKGSLHGGARLKVMLMLEEIGSPDRAEDYVIDLIAKKKRVMGFGHRVYRTHDPRGLILKRAAKKLAEAKEDMALYNIAENIEKTVMRELVEKRGKKIYANVDFWSGVLYKYLELPPMLATALFAIGRISGWIAHCLEQYSDNRLIRPRARSI